MYKKILVPLDSSELGKKILPQVEDLAMCMKSEIVLLTVGNLISSAIVNEIGENILNTIRDNSRMAAEKNLSEVAESLAAKDLKTTIRYREGNPAVEIIQAANDDGCDLIAMATHGCGEIAWVLGSVAEKVASHSNKPVLLLRVLEAVVPEAKELTDIQKIQTKIWGAE